ncbi:hypothetical protein SCG7086_BC_00130 [Chlamydiales bacterium SCGC AG-110-P3]|nr:hypothetical protein SCG7086_BC_00130 [Chlamydiales bacterium SCGC AG-110-P3]
MESIFKILEYPQGTPASRLLKKAKASFRTPKTFYGP